MKLFRLLGVAVLLFAASGTAVRADDDTRFSKSLAPADRSALGLDQLSSDQLGALDALIRRDAVNLRRGGKIPPAERFSQRLSADERHVSGLDQLPAPTVTELDRRVQALNAPPAAGTFRYASAGSSVIVPSVKIRRGPEVHGSIELMVGAGSHGYSEYGGAMTVSVEDPASGLSVAVGYAELHSKGGYLYRGCREGYWARPGDYRWW
jgi:hypothetical protein